MPARLFPRAPSIRINRNGSNRARTRGTSITRRCESILSGQGDRIRRNRGGRALGDHAAAVHPGSRTHVEDVVGAVDRLLVVLDDDDGVADIAQVFEGVEEAAVVALMQTD